MTSVAELTHRFLPAMEAAGRGRILNVASLAGLVPPSAGHTLYGAAKLWLVRPLGFRVDDYYLRRAGLDYWEQLEWHVVDDWKELAASVGDDECLAEPELVGELTNAMDRARGEHHARAWPEIEGEHLQ